MNDAGQLADVRAAIAAGRQPASAAYAKVLSSRYGQLSWQPHPRASVGCGYYSNPDEGCTQETDDAQAAYTDALIWVYGGDAAYAQKSIDILNGWSGVLKEHKVGSTYGNGQLQAAWAAETFTKAAELIRYSDAGWSSPDVAQFEDMLDSAFLPLVRHGISGGGANRLLSMADATMAIGVFTNDRSVFDDGVAAWRAQVPAAIYLSTDGPTPVLPSGTSITGSLVNAYWYKPAQYVDGLEGEDCRDISHAAMGFAAALEAAQTGENQGVHLFAEQQTRLTHGMEYLSLHANDPGAAGWACPDAPKLTDAAWTATFEIGYHHYATVDGLSLPQTRTLITSHRPTGSGLFFNWETLTHGTP